MKRLAVCVRIATCVVSLGIAFASAAAAAPPADWQAKLGPHGRWITSPRYGRVWQPTLATSTWNPYYDGHWVYTDVGQTWVSDYAWGSVPYHYGTWAVEPGRGWVWIPGDVWAPSWVVFRVGADVIGWAPVAPGFAIGASAGVVADDDSVFLYVPSQQFFAPRVRTCALPASRTAVLVTKTKLVERPLRVESRIVVNRGPGLEELRRATGRPVTVVRLESVKSFGPGIRRTIAVDESRAHGGVRVCSAGAGSTARRDGIGEKTANAYDAHIEPAHRSDDRGPQPAVARTAYDEADRPIMGRAVHQETGAADPGVRPAHQEGSAHHEAPRTTAAARTVTGGETQSDRDVKLLASRERLDRARARAVKPARPKSRS
jgi:hypothetical protein